MAGPLRITFPAAFYHVTSRENERKAVFRSKRDREKFLGYLKSATNRYRAVAHVFCLMDSRDHLLLETPSIQLPQNSSGVTEEKDNVSNPGLPLEILESKSLTALPLVMTV